MKVLLMSDRLSAPYSLAILTISDSGAKGERLDTSGDAISRIMLEEDFNECIRDIIPDDLGMIAKKLISWSDQEQIDLILTTGGTGLSPRDVTPEATRSVIDFEVPGLSESLRILTVKKTPMSVLSRSIAGVRSGCLIINLPGSPKGVCEYLEILVPVIPHALEMINGWRNHPSE